MAIAEVIVRFGEDVIALAHVEPGGRFTIGTAPGAQLAVASIGELPIVAGEDAGFVVRCPAGLATLYAGGVASPALEVELTAPVELRFARLAITIAITPIVRARQVVPRPALEWRTPAFVLASLIVHLLVWGAAVTFAHPPRAQPRVPRPPRIAHLHAPPDPRALPPPVPPPAHHAPATAAASSANPTEPTLAAASSANPTEPTPAAAPPRATARGGAGPATGTRGVRIGRRDGFVQLADGLAALAAATNIDWGATFEGTRPIYDPEAAATFGTARAFDPTQRAGFETIKTGRFQTVSSGHAAGDDYHLAGETTVDLALCDSMRCEITGGLDKPTLTRVVATRVAALAGCVGDQSLVLELEIAADGHVVKVHGHGKVARCAANVVGGLAFPAAEEATHAAFTIGYP